MKYVYTIEVTTHDPIDFFDLGENLDELIKSNIARFSRHVSWVDVLDSVVVRYD